MIHMIVLILGPKNAGFNYPFYKPYTSLDDPV